MSAVYSMFLLGNTPSETHYLVSYDRETQKATSVELDDLLYGVFAKEPVPGTIFKVRQQEGENCDNKKKIPKSQVEETCAKRAEEFTSET